MLAHAPALLLFYGLAGSGKTHIGQQVAQHTGRFFYDADTDISDAMKQALAEQRPFTDAMRDEFFPRLAGRIRQLQAQHGALVIAQGVYKQRHRAYLQAAFPAMDLWCVQCPEAVRLQRLQGRASGISAASARALLADFEPPLPGQRVLQNDGDDAAVLAALAAHYPPA